MDKVHNTARRAVLIGALTSSAALAVPALAASRADPRAGLVGLPLAAVHAKQLAEAMAMPEVMGSWLVTLKSGDASQPIHFQNGVQAAKNAQLLDFLKDGSATDLAEYHALQLGRALMNSRGGRWVGKNVPSGTVAGYDAMVFVQHPDAKPSFMLDLASMP